MGKCVIVHTEKEQCSGCVNISQHSQTFPAASYQKIPVNYLNYLVRLRLNVLWSERRLQGFSSLWGLNFWTFTDSDCFVCFTTAFNLCIQHTLWSRSLSWLTTVSHIDDLPLRKTVLWTRLCVPDVVDKTISIKYRTINWLTQVSLSEWDVFSSFDSSVCFSAQIKLSGMKLFTVRSKWWTKSNYWNNQHVFVVFVHFMLVVYWQRVKCISEKKKRIITKTNALHFPALSQRAGGTL